ncbi:MAG TPA: hypothetical protein PLL92_04195 [Alicycliphilus sp.]|nr:hypothetical protein [Alicycliphilus sp.]
MFNKRLRPISLEFPPPHRPRTTEEKIQSKPFSEENFPRLKVFAAPACLRLLAKSAGINGIRNSRIANASMELKPQDLLVLPKVTVTGKIGVRRQAGY